MKKLVIALGVVCMAWIAASEPLLAQDGDDGPGTRIVTVTSFDVPLGKRGDFMRFYRSRIAPASQLNPLVLNHRVLFHRWGSDAANMAVVNEYASFADIEADCQPCDDWNDANPIPEEGTPEREEFDEMGEMFTKYYSHHHDEIYAAPMVFAKVEGTNMGPIGTPPDDDNDD